MEDRLLARMLGAWLDRELADGAPATLSKAHEARAEQLTSPRMRGAVARSLEKLLDRAQASRGTAPLATIPPCCEQIIQAAPLMVSTVSLLRSREPVDARAVAKLKLLVGDRHGPCYRRSRPDALLAALREISEPHRHKP
jgi:hypothetical protein